MRKTYIYIYIYIETANVKTLKWDDDDDDGDDDSTYNFITFLLSQIALNFAKQNKENKKQ